MPWLPLTNEAQVHAQVSPCEICFGQSSTGTGFSWSFWFSPHQCHSTVALWIHISPWWRTIGMLVAEVQRHSLTPWTWTAATTWVYQLKAYETPFFQHVWFVIILWLLFFLYFNLNFLIAGSEDKSIIVWDTKQGRAISSLQLHIPILNLEMSTDASRIAVHLLENRCLPIVCLHNTPATYVKMPTYVAPSKEIEGKYDVFWIIQSGGTWTTAFLIILAQKL
jgi:hypothetical protein